MLDIEKKELVISEELKKKVTMICKFANAKCEIINGSIRNIKKTNVAYVEPHRLIANGTTYFILDECDKVFVNNLKTEIKMSELGSHIKANALK